MGVPNAAQSCLIAVAYAHRDLGCGGVVILAYRINAGFGKMLFAFAFQLLFLSLGQLPHSFLFGLSINSLRFWWFSLGHINY